MTERAQPGAIDSVVRNDELAQVLGQLIGGYDDGWVVPAGEPTPAAQRRSDIDTSGLNAFAISTATSSLDVTVDGGEAFAAGWCAIDTATTLSLPASTTSTVVVTWDPDALYDPDTDADRDAADSVVVDLESNISADHPRAPLYEIVTDGSGVTGTTDLRALGPVIVDGADNRVSDLAGDGVDLVDGALTVTIPPDLRPDINDLFVRNAEQDFELGLTQLDYQDGQYEVFADDSKMASSTGVKLVLGSPLNDAGYVALQAAKVGNISTEQGEFTGHTNIGIYIAISDGFGYSGSWDETVRKWDVDTLTEQEKFTGHSGRTKSIKISGGFGYSASQDETVRKWDIDTLTEENNFTGHNDDTNSIDIVGDFGYSGSHDETVRKWDIDTLTEQEKFAGHNDIVDTLYIGPDRHGYSGDWSGVIKKWDTDTLTEQDEFTGHGDRVAQIVISNGYGYSASYDGTVKKWDADTLTEQDEFTGHGGDVNGVAIENSFGYSAGGDATVKKWDVDTLTEENEFTGHESSSAVGVDVESSYGYSIDYDGIVKKWGEGITAKTSGNVEHVFDDLGFVPDRAVLSDDLRQLPTDADVYYEIGDDNGNVVTIQRSDLDGEVDVSALTSSNVQTTAYLERPDTDTETPELDSYALYLQ